MPSVVCLLTKYIQWWLTGGWNQRSFVPTPAALPLPPSKKKRYCAAIVNDSNIKKMENKKLEKYQGQARQGKVR